MTSLPLAAQVKTEAQKIGAGTVVGGPVDGSQELRRLQREYADLLAKGIQGYEDYARAKELRAKMRALGQNREQ